MCINQSIYIIIRLIIQILTLMRKCMQIHISMSIQMFMLICICKNRNRRKYNV